MALISNNPAPESLADGSEVQPSVEERRALIDRVARSEQFSRSVRLRDFLLYVGRQSLKDGCPEINEQEIGQKVFGRPTAYDRSQDNIVRVNATELRKRIDSYFATDGAHETLVLEIPRGHYRPVFHQRLASHRDRPAPIEEFPPALPASQGAKSVVPNRRRPYWLALSAAFSILLAIACAALFLQNRMLQRERRPWESKPAIAALWGNFLRSNQQTDIVMPDDSASVVEGITGHPISLGDYLSQDHIRQIQSSDLSADRKADLSEVLHHNLITFGGMLAAQRIIALDPFSQSLRLTASRFYQADAFKRDNAILIGGKKANPWVFLFDGQLNFDLDPSGKLINRHPLAGEQSVYSQTYSQKGPMGYSVVAYFPNPSRTGSTIIIAGTDSDASNAAAEFLTSEDQLQKFRNTLHVDRFPYFEVLLKTSQVSGTSFSSEVIAYRTYPGLQ